MVNVNRGRIRIIPWEEERYLLSNQWELSRVWHTNYFSGIGDQAEEVSLCWGGHIRGEKQEKIMTSKWLNPRKNSFSLKYMLIRVWY